MPWSNGVYTPRTGTFTGSDLFAQIEQADRDVRVDDMDGLIVDLKAVIENLLTRDGQNSPTGNLPMNSNKHTGVADAVADTEYASLGQTRTLIAAPIAFEPLTWSSPLAWAVNTNARATVAVTGDMSGVTLTGAVDGGIYVARFQQDATGGHSMTWPTGWLWPDGGEVPDLSSAANAIDILTLMVIDNDICAILNKDWRV